MLPQYVLAGLYGWSRWVSCECFSCHFSTAFGRLPHEVYRCVSRGRMKLSSKLPSLIEEGSEKNRRPSLIHLIPFFIQLISIRLFTMEDLSIVLTNVDKLTMVCCKSKIHDVANLVLKLIKIVKKTCFLFI